MAKIITLQQLAQKGACEDGLEMFERIFGQSVEVKEENIEQALNFFGCETGWLAMNFLNDASLEKWEQGGKTEHIESAPPKDCPGCRAMMLKFIELYSTQED